MEWTCDGGFLCTVEEYLARK